MGDPAQMVAGVVGFGIAENDIDLALELNADRLVGIQ